MGFMMIKTAIFEDKYEPIGLNGPPEKMYYHYIVEDGVEQIDSSSIDCTRWHREDGPAFWCEDGHEEYWIIDERHRYEGPAVVYGRDVITKNEYWIRNNEIDGEQYLSWIKENGIDLKNLSDNDKIMIDMKWGVKTYE